MFLVKSEGASGRLLRLHQRVHRLRRRLPQRADGGRAQAMYSPQPGLRRRVRCHGAVATRRTGSNEEIIRLMLQAPPPAGRAARNASATRACMSTAGSAPTPAAAAPRPARRPCAASRESRHRTAGAAGWVSPFPGGSLQSRFLQPAQSRLSDLGSRSLRAPQAARRPGTHAARPARRVRMRASTTRS